MEIKHGSVRTRGHKPLWDKKEKVAEAAKMNIEFTHELVWAHPKAMTSVKRKKPDYCPGNETKNLLCQYVKVSESLLNVSLGDNNNSIRNVPADDEEQ